MALIIYIHFCTSDPNTLIPVRINQTFDQLVEHCRCNVFAPTHIYSSSPKLELADEDESIKSQSEPVVVSERGTLAAE